MWPPGQCVQPTPQPSPHSAPTGFLGGVYPAVLPFAVSHCTSSRKPYHTQCVLSLTSRAFQSEALKVFLGEDVLGGVGR